IDFAFINEGAAVGNRRRGVRAGVEAKVHIRVERDEVIGFDAADERSRESHRYRGGEAAERRGPHGTGPCGYAVVAEVGEVRLLIVRVGNRDGSTAAVRRRDTVADKPPVLLHAGGNGGAENGV